MPLVEDIESIEHSKREELASAIFLSLDLLENALPVGVGLSGNQCGIFEIAFAFRNRFEHEDIGQREQMYVKIAVLE
ncbi:hypothetical protein D3D01_18070 [Haloarcula sp. Atlit-7R]|nr:hypothetical protein D3D01_18070 [Haloarcula sp. Atlit-7R]